MITVPDDTPAHELVILKARVAELLKAQEFKLIRPGNIASFIGRDGQKYFVRIDKVNTKTVSGKQCTAEGDRIENGHPGWRVAISMLTPVVAAPKVADTLPPPKIAADKPTFNRLSATPDSW